MMSGYFTSPMLSFIELITLIEKRPAMYIGKPYISCLRAFLNGWYSAFNKVEIESTEPAEEGLESFQKWIEKTYQLRLTPHGWDSLILHHSNGEADALDNFFKLFNEWRARPRKPRK